MHYCTISYQYWTLQGCVKYVGFHVFDHDHLACCESDFCEDWIEDQFESMAQSGSDPNSQYYGDADADADGAYPDDDDDDEDYEDDDYADEF